MNIVKVILIALSFCIVETTKIFAQDLQSSLEKTWMAYSKIKSFDFEMTASIYSVNDKLPVEKQKAWFSSSGNSSLYKMNDMVLLENEQYRLMIDEDSQTLIFGAAEKNKIDEAVDINEMLSEYKSLLEAGIGLSDSIVYNGVVRNTEHYTIYDADGQIIKIDVFIDTGTFLIKKMAYVNNPILRKEVAKVEMEYTKINLLPQFSSKHFSESKYVSINDNKIVGTGKYKDFNIYVQGVSENH